MSFSRFLKDPDYFDEMWKELRKIVESELRRRGLWDGSPERLGFPAADWRDALDDLVADIVLHLFVRRRKGFVALVEAAQKDGDDDPDIGGAVRLAVRYYLHDRHRLNDPIGHRLYRLLRRAAEGAILAETLWILDQAGKTEAKVLGGSVLSFDPDADSGRAVRREDLKQEIEIWVDRLIPAVVTAEGPAVTKVADAIEREFGRMPQIPIVVFIFGILVGVVRVSVRARWIAIWEAGLDLAWDGEEDEALRVLTQRPEALDLEEREALLARLKCVEKTLDALPSSGKQEQSDREGLRLLWNVLRRSEGKRPGERGLAELVGMKRTRLRRLLVRLREIYEACG